MNFIPSIWNATFGKNWDTASWISEGGGTLHQLCLSSVQEQGDHTGEHTLLGPFPP